MIRVLVVDDSTVLRQSLRSILESDPEVEVVAEAKDGQEAVAMATRMSPDVVTMDIRMPRMNGLDAIRSIMTENPIPIVVVTGIDLDQEMDIFSQAMKLGAVSALKRPQRSFGSAYDAFTTKLIEQVRLMSDVKVIRRSRLQGAKKITGIHRSLASTARQHKIKIVAIGASTGGPVALQRILSPLPADLPAPVLVVQHMASGFVDGLARWLDASCRLAVRVAKAREKARPGVVYLAPDDHHMKIGDHERIDLNQEPPIDGHRPSITVLFEAVAQSYGPAGIALILTGMGTDGAAGMKALREAGTTTIAQDKESCVVYGMPKEAITRGAVEHVVPLDRMAWTVMALCKQPAAGT